MRATKKTQIWQFSAMEIAQAIQEKEISCEETIVSHFERIETLNMKINAVSVVLQESAHEAAKKADKLLASGQEPPSLLGVPMTVKENIDCVGSATSFGVHVLKDARPKDDAPHVKNLKNAGAILIARTNMPDLGLRLHTDNDLHGATLNPWDVSRTPGGSSGGDAAAVATGMAPLGLGNDYGGSLRQPACFCGVAAIRPGYGRVPDYMSLLPSEPAISMQLFMVQGPIVRHVRDLFPVLEAMSRIDPRDPHWTQMPFLKYNASGPIRVARSLYAQDTEIDPAVKDGMDKAADTLMEAGYIVEEVEPPRLDELWKLWIDLTGAEIQAFTLPNVKPIASKGALEFLTHWVELFPDCGPSGYMAGLAVRNAIAREWSLFQQKYPLILGPVVATQPFEVNRDIKSRDDFQAILGGYPLTMGANVLGLPALALPVGISNGLPLGVQLIGPRGHERLCIDAAQAIEDRLGVISPIMVE